jgi:hypothetical protein
MAELRDESRAIEGLADDELDDEARRIREGTVIVYPISHSFVSGSCLGLSSAHIKLFKISTLNAIIYIFLLKSARKSSQGSRGETPC